MNLEFFNGRTVLVTGCAGFIGSHLVERLAAAGANVVGVDNLSRGQLDNIRHLIDTKKIKFIEGDIQDFSLMMSVTKNSEIVFHQAALGSVNASIQNPLETHASNSTGFLCLLEACRQNNVSKFIYASSSSVYGDLETEVKVEELVGNPLSPYAVTKLTDEMYAKVYAGLYPNMQITGLRYFNIFGPKQNPNGPYAAAIPIFITAALKNKPVEIYGDGLQSRDFTFVENAVNANLLAAMKKLKSGEVYNVACGETHTLLKVLSIIEEIAGTKIQKKFSPPRQGDIRYSLASIQKAKSELGYSPQTGLYEGLKKTIDWFNMSLR